MANMALQKIAREHNYRAPSFAELADLARKAPRSGKIAHNTYIRCDSGGGKLRVFITYHATIVVVAEPDAIGGTVYTVRTGGWHTRTTVALINTFAPAGLYTHKGTLKSCHGEFAEGMILRRLPGGIVGRLDAPM